MIIAKEKGQGKGTENTGRGGSEILDRVARKFSTRRHREKAWRKWRNQLSRERAFSEEGPASTKVLRWGTCLGCPRNGKEVATEAAAHIPLIISRRKQNVNTW